MKSAMVSVRGVTGTPCPQRVFLRRFCASLARFSGVFGPCAALPPFPHLLSIGLASLGDENGWQASWNSSAAAGHAQQHRAPMVDRTAARDIVINSLVRQLQRERFHCASRCPRPSAFYRGAKYTMFRHENPRAPSGRGAWTQRLPTKRIGRRIAGRRRFVPRYADPRARRSRPKNQSDLISDRRSSTEGLSRTSASRVHHSA